MIFNDVNLDDFICDQVNNLESDNYQAFKGFADIVPNLDRFLKKALKSSYSEDVFINKDYFKTCFLMAVKLYDGIAVSLNDQYKRYDLEYNQSFVDKLNRFSKLVFKLDSNPIPKVINLEQDDFYLEYGELKKDCEVLLTKCKSAPDLFYTVNNSSRLDKSIQSSLECTLNRFFNSVNDASLDDRNNFIRKINIGNEKINYSNDFIKNNVKEVFKNCLTKNLDKLIYNRKIYEINSSLSDDDRDFLHFFANCKKNNVKPENLIRKVVDDNVIHLDLFQKFKACLDTGVINNEFNAGEETINNELGELLFDDKKFNEVTVSYKIRKQQNRTASRGR